MRLRALLLAGLLAALPTMLAPRVDAAVPTATLHAPHRTVEIGKPVTLTAQLSGFDGAVTFDVQVRTKSGWRSALKDNRLVHRSQVRATVVPRRIGRNVYRVLVTHADLEHHTYSRPVVVQARLAPHASVRSAGWIYKDLGTAIVEVHVRLSHWLPVAPELSLQQLTDGTWTTLDTQSADRSLNQPWWVELNGVVHDQSQLRVVGSGRHWTVNIPVEDRSIIQAAGALTADGPAVTLPPADYIVSRQLTFEATVGERLALIKDGAAGWSLRYPNGAIIQGGSSLEYASALPASGRYTLYVGGSSEPVTVRLVHPQVTTVEADGSTVTLPPTVDPRVPREIVVPGEAGDVVDGSVWQGSNFCGYLTHDFTSDGDFRGGIWCETPTSGTLQVRLRRAKVYDLTLGTPTTVTADTVGQPVAFRFTTPAADTTLDLTTPWSGHEACFFWLGTNIAPCNITTDDRWFHDAGSYVMVAHPLSNYAVPLSGDVTLSVSPD